MGFFFCQLHLKRDVTVMFNLVYYIQPDSYNTCTPLGIEYLKKNKNTIQPKFLFIHLLKKSQPSGMLLFLLDHGIR